MAIYNQTGRSSNQPDLIRKVIEIDTSKAVSSMSSLSSATDDGLKSFKDYRRRIEELSIAVSKLDDTTEEYQETQSRLNKLIGEYNRAVSNSKYVSTAAEGSYDALAKKLSELRKQWKATSDEAERDSLGKQIKDINDQLKGLDASIGNYQRNVGNYASAFTGATDKIADGINQLLPGFKQIWDIVSKLVKGIGGISELGGVFSGLGSSLKSASKGDDIVGGVVGGVVGNSLAPTLADAVETGIVAGITATGTSKAAKSAGAKLGTEIGGAAASATTTAIAAGVGTAVGSSTPTIAKEVNKVADDIAVNLQSKLVVGAKSAVEVVAEEINAGKFVKPIVDQVADVVTGVKSGIQAIAEQPEVLNQDVVDMVVKRRKALTAGLSDRRIPSVDKQAEVAIKGLADAYEEAGEQLGAFIAGVGDSEGVITDMAGRTKKAAAGIGNLSKAFTDALEPISNVTAGVDGVVSGIEDTAGAVRDLSSSTSDLDSGLTAAGAAATDLGDGLTNVGDAAGSAKTGFSKLVSVIKGAKSGIGIAIAAIGALIGTVITLVKRNIDARKELLEWRRTLADIERPFSEQAVLLSTLSAKYKELASDDDRSRFLRAYKAELEDVTGSVVDLSNAEDVLVHNTDRYVESLMNRARAEAAYSELVTLEGERRKIAQETRAEIERSDAAAVNRLLYAGTYGGSAGGQLVSGAAADYASSIAADFESTFEDRVAAEISKRVVGIDKKIEEVLSIYVDSKLKDSVVDGGVAAVKEGVSLLPTPADIAALYDEVSKRAVADSEELLKSLDADDAAREKLLADIAERWRRDDDRGILGEIADLDRAYDRDLEALKRYGEDTTELTRSYWEERAELVGAYLAEIAGKEAAAAADSMAAADERAANQLAAESVLLEARAKMYQDLYVSISTILSSIGDGWERLTEQEYEQGKISESTYKSRLKAIKAFQVGAVVVQSAGSIMDIWKGYTAEVGTINAETAAATGPLAAATKKSLDAVSLTSAIAKSAGVAAQAAAQIAAIKSASLSAASPSSVAATITPASSAITPTYTSAVIGDRDVDVLRNAVSEGTSSGGRDIRVWVLDSDIRTALGRVEIRESESTF